MDKPSAPEDRIRQALRRYWGYDSFRPGQESIIRSIAAGRDACVIMPTGGGKSLCYQLPAALTEGRTAVVISPLIALMQDQVAHLKQMGIPAVFLNSATAESERSEVKRRAMAGEYRLLYISPERLVLDSTAEWLRRVPVSFFAIDEAHCISEWGHDFRPEYRQLSRLRELFPRCGIAAFTASATQRVRHDIIEQLCLREPHKHIASFRRPNLRYHMRQCDSRSQNQLMLGAVKRAPSGSVIVYSPTVARVGEVVDLLEEAGIAAVGYHGKMDAASRRENQERWMTDEVRVMVGTMAFGLGINKASVRAVIHLSLPKSIEQYYQESGRAGRDGMPSDCYLFWQSRDAALHAHFINQISDGQERASSWQRYHQARGFIESRECRQVQICRHFGEHTKAGACGQCDVCSGLGDWMALPVEEKRGRRRKARTGALLGEQYEAPFVAERFQADGGSELIEYLRQWRRDVARAKGSPAFVVLHDTTLENVARAAPESMEGLRRVSGIGEAKARTYGEEILAALRRFREGQRAASDWRPKVSQPAVETLKLLEAGKTFEEIAQIRGRKVQTVVAMVAEMIEAREANFQEAWFPAETYEKIATTATRLGLGLLTPLKEALGAEISYDEIRLVVAHLRSQDKTQPPKS